MTVKPRGVEVHAYRISPLRRIYLFVQLIPLRRSLILTLSGRTHPKPDVAVGPFTRDPVLLLPRWVLDPLAYGRTG